MLGLCLLAAAGCEPPLPLIPVSGSVVYQGEPLQFGGVMMQPVAGGPVARGTIEEGVFVMQTQGEQGVLPGAHRVRVTCFANQKPGAAPSSAAGEPSLGRSLIPEHYNRFSSSGLTVDVRHADSEPILIELEDP